LHSYRKKVIEKNARQQREVIKDPSSRRPRIIDIKTLVIVQLNLHHVIPSIAVLAETRDALLACARRSSKST
jgi:hypothetical protein